MSTENEEEICKCGCGRTFDDIIDEAILELLEEDENE